MSSTGAGQSKTSAASFAAWALESYAYLITNANMAPLVQLQSIYNIACNINPAELAPQDPLIGLPLWQAMSLYIGEAAPYRTLLQNGAPGTWPELQSHIPKLREYYIAQAAWLEAKAEGLDAKEPVPPPYALEAARLYLHVLAPESRLSDWRIGLNVKPASIAKAVELLAPLSTATGRSTRSNSRGPQAC